MTLDYCVVTRILKFVIYNIFFMTGINSLTKIYIIRALRRGGRKENLKKGRVGEEFWLYRYVTRTKCIYIYVIYNIDQ